MEHIETPPEVVAKRFAGPLGILLREPTDRPRRLPVVEYAYVDRLQEEVEERTAGS